MDQGFGPPFDVQEIGNAIRILRLKAIYPGLLGPCKIVGKRLTDCLIGCLIDAKEESFC